MRWLSACLAARRHSEIFICDGPFTRIWQREIKNLEFFGTWKSLKVSFWNSSGRLECHFCARCGGGGVEFYEYLNKSATRLLYNLI